MSNKHSLLKAFSTIGLILTLGVSMCADAGLFGFGGTSWKEEVQLHEGSKIIVERSQTRGGRGEVGQSPIKEHTITFSLPGSSQAMSWTSEYSEDVGRANFNLLALHILNGTPYLVTEPNLCLSYNKWGRPNPPYVFFKHDGKAWQRIPLTEFPAVFKEMNLVNNTSKHEKELISLGTASADRVKEFNDSLRQPELKTILREPYPTAAGSCGEMIYDGKGGWIGMGWFRRQPSYEACLNYCEQEKMSAQYCPCNILFKEKK